MCESKVTGINVEIMGRRLSFTYEEAVALKGVLQDALRETPFVERFTPPVVPPMYGPMTPLKDWWCGSSDDHSNDTIPHLVTTI